MTKVKKVGQKTRYEMQMRKCIGCTCFSPGMYQHRGATGSSGSRNTGHDSATCMHSAYRGCPAWEDRGYDKKLARQRREEGWRVV